MITNPNRLLQMGVKELKNFDKWYDGNTYSIHIERFYITIYRRLEKIYKEEFTKVWNKQNQ